jgi:hypothetical protein
VLVLGNNVDVDAVKTVRRREKSVQTQSRNGWRLFRGKVAFDLLPSPQHCADDCAAGPSSSPAIPKEEPKPDLDEDSDSDVEIVPETDQERTRTMRDALDQSELDGLRSSELDYDWPDDFVAPARSGAGESETWTAALNPGPSFSSVVAGTASSRTAENDKAPAGGVGPSHALDAEKHASSFRTASSAGQTPSLKLGRIVEDEVNFRKKEAVGLAGKKAVQKLGGSQGSSQSAPSSASAQEATVPSTATMKGRGDSHEDEGDRGEWECLVCTL